LIISCCFAFMFGLTSSKMIPTCFSFTGKR
jgi:hypothetical protein